MKTETRKLIPECLTYFNQSALGVGRGLREKELLDEWGRGWSRAGFQPVNTRQWCRMNGLITNLNKHREVAEKLAQINKAIRETLHPLKTVNPVMYERACYDRWEAHWTYLALKDAEMGYRHKALMMDYDIANTGFSPWDAEQRYGCLDTRNNPCAMVLDAEDLEAMIWGMVWLAKKPEIQKLPHVSDMLLVIEGCRWSGSEKDAEIFQKVIHSGGREGVCEEFKSEDLNGEVRRAKMIHLKTDNMIAAGMKPEDKAWAMKRIHSNREPSVEETYSW